jgi:formamidopyrimidine-DNA glycosylase
VPELPDVEAYRRRFERLARGRVVGRAEIDASHPRALLAPSRAVLGALQGRRVGEARRIGKWLFARVGRAWLVLHFGMTGDLEAMGGDATPEHARLVLRFRGGGGVAFTDPRRFGKIGLARSPQEFAQEHDLGPDALGLSGRRFLERFQDRRGSIKAALLDQSVVAGVGNLWADESLWRARLHPAAAIENVRRAKLRALHRALEAALRQGIRHKERAAAAWLLPHRHAGGHCPRCGAKLARGTIAGRTTYWCPREQATSR